MKQILQNLGNGVTELVDVPCPLVGPGQLLIGTTHSLISAGTERMLVDFGKAGPIGKARQQPDKVRMVLDKIRTDGLMPTVDSVRNKLAQPLPLGYCNVGVLLETGEGVEGFAPGQRIASNGRHAEVVSVPRNLCARIPDAVSDEAAAFTVVGAIALQGIRLVQPSLGEAVVVTGLGLIGQLAVQLLRANGCRVLGIDPDAQRRQLARSFGAEVVDSADGDEVLRAAAGFSRGRGVDAVVVTAATRSSEPMHQAALMCRQRGRIVLVGVAGLELSRDDFFKKELTFQVSASYGPGRYDPEYEDKGHDYPLGFVRWTEQRNFEAVLDMLADGRLVVEPLISHRFELDQAMDAYAVVAGSEPSLGILMTYPRADGGAEGAADGGAGSDPARATTVVLGAGAVAGSSHPSLAFVGSGNYATAVLIPAFRTAGARLAVVASNTGVSGVHAGRKYGFERTTTDTDALFEDDAIDALVVSTRHDSHGHFVLRALAAGKAVFVEKPLCLDLAELDAIEAACGGGARAAPLLMVGFNRRFAPQVVKMRQLLAGTRGPKSLVMTVNAGAIPGDHWTQDAAVGGGRIVGEACHFIDLLRFLADSPISGYQRMAMDSDTADTVSLQLRFADGSIGTVHYFANGSKAFPKERLEVFSAGRVLQLDNFRRLRGFGWPGFRRMNLWRQDKGQRACARAFTEALRSGGPAPIPLQEIFEVSRASIALARVDPDTPCPSR